MTCHLYLVFGTPFLLQPPDEADSRSVETNLLRTVRLELVYYPDNAVKDWCEDITHGNEPSQ